MCPVRLRPGPSHPPYPSALGLSPACWRRNASIRSGWSSSRYFASASCATLSGPPVNLTWFSGSGFSLIVLLLSSKAGFCPWADARNWSAKTSKRTNRRFLFVALMKSCSTFHIAPPRTCTCIFRALPWISKRLLLRPSSPGLFHTEFCCLFPHAAIDYPPDPERIGFFQFVRERRIGKSLITDQAREAENSLTSYRSGAPIRCRRIRTAVDHCVRDFHTCGEAIEDQPSNLGFENCDKVGEFTQVLFRTVDGCGQVPLE